MLNYISFFKSAIYISFIEPTWPSQILVQNFWELPSILDQEPDYVVLLSSYMNYPKSKLVLIFTT